MCWNFLHCCVRVMKMMAPPLIITATCVLMEESRERWEWYWFTFDLCCSVQDTVVVFHFSGRELLLCVTCQSESNGSDFIQRARGHAIYRRSLIVRKNYWVPMWIDAREGNPAGYLPINVTFSPTWRKSLYISIIYATDCVLRCIAINNRHVIVVGPPTKQQVNTEIGLSAKTGLSANWQQRRRRLQSTL